MCPFPQVIIRTDPQQTDFIGTRFMLEDVEYEVTRHFASGGSSLIFNAQHGEAGQVISIREGKALAIKLLKDPLPDNTVYVERLMREADLLCNLHHPHISQGYAGAVWRDRPCVIMEKIEGRSLARTLRMYGSLPMSIVLEMALEVLLALNYLHLDRRIIAHRDIKPANIMLARDGTAKLIDFGTARTDFYVGCELKTNLVGSLPYLAPEQIESSAQADIRSDMYSLGAILFEAYSGVRTFQNTSLGSLLEAKREGRIPLVGFYDEMRQHPAFAKSFSRLLERSLAPRPEDRYQTPSEFIDDIRRVQGIWQDVERRRSDEQEVTSSMRNLLKQESKLTGDSKLA